MSFVPSKLRRGRIAAAAVTLCAAGLATAIMATASNAASSGSNVATFALPAGAAPNWIFPMIDSAHSSVDNRNQFEYLMYRPLYFFGKGTEPVINEAMSIAKAPVYSKNFKNVTLTLKSWKWSDGSPVTATGVAFWLNMLKAVGHTEWAYYVPGGIPDGLSGWTVKNAHTIVLHNKSAVSPAWFTNNELSQITPFPHAWDVTGPGKKSNCETTVADCKAVWTYLYGLSKQTSTYANSPIWGVVDGPWKLTGYQSTGQATFMRNTSYSGPVEGNTKEFIEEPFTTDEAEFNVLRSGGLTVGYLPITDLPQKAALSSKYNFAPWIVTGINYFPENYNNPTFGAVFHQLYFRQAMQSMINQKMIIDKLDKGYGSPDYGPVPNSPASPFLTSYIKNDPFPYSPAKAKKLLTSHGWSVTAGKAATCTKPGTASNECGAGIKQGLALNINLLYASGNTTLTEQMEGMKTTFAQAGIVLNLSTAPFDTVISDSVPCKPTQASCKWELDNWGGGWSYSMDHLPNGDVVLGTGAGDNFGSYSDPKVDALINKTRTVPGSMPAAVNYMTKQVPVIWQPKADYSLTEIAKNLTNVVPQIPTYNLAPENWKFK